MTTHGGFGELYLQAETAYRGDRIANYYGHRSRNGRRHALRRRHQTGTPAVVQCQPVTS